MNGGELIGLILDRLGNAKGSEAFFSVDEVTEWPSAALESLIAAGILKRTSSAKSIVCDGCEQACFMPVHILPADGKRPVRLFVSCDKRDDIGRVPVMAARLEQWQLTGGQLSKALNKLLGLVGTPSAHNSSKRWALGMLKAGEHKALVTLVIENNALLNLAGHDVPVIEVLTFSSGIVSADLKTLGRLLAKPGGQSGSHRYVPSNSRRVERKQATQERVSAWRKVATELRRRPQGKSERWVAEQISKTPIAAGLSAETIRKNIRR